MSGDLMSTEFKSLTWTSDTELEFENEQMKRCCGAAAGVQNDTTSRLQGLAEPASGLCKRYCRAAGRAACSQCDLLLQLTALMDYQGWKPQSSFLNLEAVQLSQAVLPLASKTRMMWGLCCRARGHFQCLPLLWRKDKFLDNHKLVSLSERIMIVDQATGAFPGKIEKTSPAKLAVYSSSCSSNGCFVASEVRLARSRKSVKRATWRFVWPELYGSLFQIGWSSKSIWLISQFMDGWIPFVPEVPHVPSQRSYMFFSSLRFIFPPSLYRVQDSVSLKL